MKELNTDDTAKNIVSNLVPNILGKAPTLEDYEGDWDDVFGVEKDDTFYDVDEMLRYLSVEDTGYG